MKKLLTITLALLMLLALGACSSDETPENENTPAATDNFDSSRRISVFTREDGSGTRDAFVSITGVGDDMYQEAVILTATSEVRSSVEGNLYGIGYISTGSINASIKVLSVGGVMPSDATIIDGSYPIQRPFLVVTNNEKDSDPLVQDFIAFMLSAQGQEIASDGYTSSGNTGDYTPAGLSGTIRVGGSTSMDSLMQKFRTAYIELNPDVRIEISGGGSGTGISEATGGVIDIGMSSRGLREGEKDALNEYTVALDGVAVIVNNGNPINNIAIETVKDIFTGETTSWSQIND